MQRCKYNCDCHWHICYMLIFYCTTPSLKLNCWTKRFHQVSAQHRIPRNDQRSSQCRTKNSFGKTGSLSNVEVLPKHSNPLPRKQQSSYGNSKKREEIPHAHSNQCSNGSTPSRQHPYYWLMQSHTVKRKMDRIRDHSVLFSNAGRRVTRLTSQGTIHQNHYPAKAATN